MSASERLRALMVSSATYNRDAICAALPLIADVVEAAENLLVYDSDKAETKLDASLTALRNALEKQ